jgi:hypothetical protein
MGHGRRRTGCPSSLSQVWPSALFRRLMGYISVAVIFFIMLIYSCFLSKVASWLPTDAVVNGIMYVVFSRERLPVALNMVHPQPVTWNSVIFAIKDAVADQLGKSLEIISFQEWYSRLASRADHANEKDMVQIVSISITKISRLWALDIPILPC